MPLYKTRKSAEVYGYAVGILLAEGTGPRAPGDVANATSYRYPVLYKRVAGASAERLATGDPQLEPAVVSAAQALEAEGVKGISSNCSFFANYQDAVTKAVRVPVFLSSLMQLPFIAASLGRKRAIGIITGDARALGNRLPTLSGAPAESQLVVRGLEGEAAFRRAILEGGDALDTALVETALVKTALAMIREQPAMGALLLEGAALPPYAQAVREASGLPVFDFLTMIDFYQQTAHRAHYAGYY
ncbi:MAG TPA: aspartate/glutamate racemase family protein [Alphaproteobacteria bacterium]|nr:aspartate/glutamate racemase family protein [Alphaproteobacteria bacterium]